MQIDIVRNQIGGMVNNYLAQEAVSPREMRYILKAILGEVAEMELTQNYIAQAQAQAENQKHEMAHETDNEG
jgi:DNA-binding transcriptional regulator YdaS (Cro superfamily)